MSYKEKVERWLEEARERLPRIIPGTRWHRETEKIIREYERLLQQMNEKKQREPGEDASSELDGPSHTA
jgi:hypothetical protein